MATILRFCAAHPLPATLWMVLGVGMIAWTLLALREVEAPAKCPGGRLLDGLAGVLTLAGGGLVASLLIGA